jgi:membrane-associated protease RseP (regulator of RpoE activity)
VDLLKATTPMEAVQYSWEEFSYMLNEATSSIQRFRQRGEAKFGGVLYVLKVPLALTLPLPCHHPPHRRGGLDGAPGHRAGRLRCLSISPRCHPRPLTPLLLPPPSRQAGADLAAVDPTALIKFAAFISINLAVVNALPVRACTTDRSRMSFTIC